MKTITQAKAATLILNAGNQVFGVTFSKRSTGEDRSMTARVGVSKGVTGAGMKYDPKKHKLLIVSEFVSVSERDKRGQFVSNDGKAQFRAIPVDGIKRLKIGGTEYTVSK